MSLSDLGTGDRLDSTVLEVFCSPDDCVVVLQVLVQCQVFSQDAVYGRRISVMHSRLGSPAKGAPAACVGFVIKK